MAVYDKKDHRASNYWNPLRTRRAGILGISRLEFCRRTGIPEITVTKAEGPRYVNASPSVMAGLQSLGVDCLTLPQEYLEWRARCER